MGRTKKGLASNRIGMVGNNYPFLAFTAMHLMVQRLVGLVEDINNNLQLLKVHLPYHESDHVLNLAYNLPAGGIPQRLGCRTHSRSNHRRRFHAALPGGGYSGFGRMRQPSAPGGVESAAGGIPQQGSLRGCGRTVAQTYADCHRSSSPRFVLPFRNEYCWPPAWAAAGLPSSLAQADAGFSACDYGGFCDRFYSLEWPFVGCFICCRKRISTSIYGHFELFCSVE
jgi:hypothetical protein